MNELLPSTQQSPTSLHQWWRLQRGLLRVAIRVDMNHFMQRFPRRINRFVPILGKNDWTKLEPGPTQIVQNNITDDTYFTYVRWRVSGLRPKEGQPSKKIWGWSGDWKQASPPDIWLLRRSDYDAKEVKEVHAHMQRIYDLETQYQSSIQDYIDSVRALSRTITPNGSLVPITTCQHIPLGQLPLLARGTPNRTSKRTMGTREHQSDMDEDDQ